MEHSPLFKSLHGIDMTNEAVGKTASFALIPIMLAVLFEIVMRYFFMRPTNWAHEFSQLTFVVYCMLLGGYALYHGSHVNIDLVYAKLSQRGKAIMDVCTSPLFFFYCIVMLATSFGFATRAIEAFERSTSSWGPYTWPIKQVMPIALFLLFIQGVAKLIRDVKLAFTGKELS
jgi:TRAP-type mannitol/chloroaromatic compound transport system permease small subunit